MPNRTLATTCCIVGGGPAGIMLGYLLARKGIAVTVLEKHKDFFRDFRGDTVHPSTLEVIFELGLLDEFLKVPHQRLGGIGGAFGDYHFRAADFSRLPTHCKFVALMPQWDFLDFFAQKARGFPNFSLLMEHEAVGLRENHGQVDKSSPTRLMAHSRSAPDSSSDAMAVIPSFARQHTSK